MEDKCWSSSTNIIPNGDLISAKYTPITQKTFLNTEDTERLQDGT